MLRIYILWRAWLLVNQKPYRYRVGSIIPPSRSEFSGRYILTRFCLSGRQGNILSASGGLPGFIGPGSSVLFRLQRTTFCALPRFGFAYSVRFYDGFRQQEISTEGIEFRKSPDGVKMSRMNWWLFNSLWGLTSVANLAYIPETVI